MTQAEHHVTVIGVGNPFRGDDAVGKVVVEQLRDQLPPDVTSLEETGDGVELLDAWKGTDCVILIDAVQSGAPPGTIHRLDASREKLPAWFSHASTHSFGVAEAIELGRAMGEIPPKLIVYGIEGLDFSAGTELSPEVAEIVPKAAMLILQEIRDTEKAKSAVR